MHNLTLAMQLNRAWRVLATAIAFASFGLGGLLLRLIYFPLLTWLQPDPIRRAAQARWAVHRSFALHIELMRVLGILRYQIHGLERLQRPGLLVLANHPTLIDVVFLISLLPNADCVVKSKLANNPFTRGPVRASRYLCNDSGVGLIEDCIASVRAGSSLIIFPEGTRTPSHGPMKLQRGAANIAVRGQLAITPVRIRCTPLSLTKGLPWWQVPVQPMQFTIAVDEDIAISPFLVAANGEPALASRQLTDYLQRYYSNDHDDAAERDGSIQPDYGSEEQLHASA